jgi:hypothetical protein
MSEAKARSGRSGTDPGKADRRRDEEPGQKNGKVLHTRIPEPLDREIKKRARNLGMSVSTVVRNVLLHTFDLVEDIVTDSANIAMSIAGEDTHPPLDRARSRRLPASRATPEAEVLAWQQAILNLNAVCARCNTILAKGSAAAIGIRDAPGPRTIVCAECLATLVQGPPSGRRRVK